VISNFDLFTRNFVTPHRKIVLIQNHHTYKPSYEDFTGTNHEKLINGMRNWHINYVGMSDIAQHITTFPDGLIAYGNHGRNIEIDPAGIRGANGGAICIEHIGNFDTGNDTMTDEQKICILKLNKFLGQKCMLPIDIKHYVYHHWFDRTTGERTGGTGNTKTCPGTNWFTGNSEKDAETFLQLVAMVMPAY